MKFKRLYTDNYNVRENRDKRARFPHTNLYITNYISVFYFHRGLYITINDIGHVYDILCNWPETQIKVCSRAK